MSQARYYILFTKITKAHKRKFGPNGTEIEPNFSETTKVSTGYLNSSYGMCSVPVLKKKKIINELQKNISYK